MRCHCTICFIAFEGMPAVWSSFERYFYELTWVFTAAAFVTAEEYKESSRERAVWGRDHVLIPRTALAFNVPPLFSWHDKPWASTWRCWPVT